MEQGKLVFRVQFDQNTKLEMNSNKRLNNIADMTTVSATVQNSKTGKKLYYVNELKFHDKLFNIFNNCMKLYYYFNVE